MAQGVECWTVRGIMLNRNGELDTLLARAVEGGAAPGLVAMVADPVALLYAGCAGSRDGYDPMTLDSVFWLASLTKLVTAVAALQQVEQGRLALDAPIDTVLPELGGYHVLTGFGPGDVPLVRAPSRAITLRHLLSHSSGLSSDLFDPVLLRARGDAGPTSPQRLAALRGPLRFDPGDGWIYGVGSDWAGLAVEAVSGQSLSDYFAQEIFAPIGMRDTGFAVPAARRAQLYQRTGDTEFAAIASPVDDRSLWEYDPGGGGLFGPAGDYVRFLQALLSGGRAPDGRILGEPLVGLLFEPQTGSIRAGALPAAVAGMNAPFDLFPEMASAWSLGGLVNPEAAPGGRHAGSLGWAGWANTYYWIDRDAGMCAVLMAQYLPFADPAMIATLRSFEAQVYGRPAERAFG